MVGRFVLISPVKAKYFNNDIPVHLSTIFTRPCCYANVGMGAALTAGYYSFWLHSIRPSGSAFHDDICGYNKKRGGVNITGEIERRALTHDDLIKWKHFPRYWPFVRGIHRSPVISPNRDQWRGALMFSLICVWINGWVNNREAGDWRRYRAYYDVIVMLWWVSPLGLFRKYQGIPINLFPVVWYS